MTLNDKYRPTNFDELAGQDEVREQLASIDSLDDIQHLILVGPPGVGKTTTAEILREQLFDSPEAKRQNYKEMNASEDRGIDTARNDIKDFVRLKAIGASKNMLFLDEADQLTDEAQQALRRTIEKYENNCVFILTGNNPDGFIDAIKSRCTVLEYQPVETGAIEERLRFIADQEGYEYDGDDITTIASNSNGDVRTAINTLWLCTRDGVVDTDNLLAKDDLDILVEELYNLNFLSAREEKDRLLRQGHSPRKLVKYLYEYITDLDEGEKFLDDGQSFPEQVRVTWLEEIGEADFRMAQDTVEELQLDQMLWRIVESVKDLNEQDQLDRIEEKIDGLGHD